MAYSKTNYVDGVTPLNAKNFNNNESALDQAVKDVASISQALVQIDDKVDGKSDIGHTHSELHSHSNKSVLDGVTSAKVTEWNNKSNFSGNYNDLTNKPTIPTVDVNKSYVDTELDKKSNTGHEHSEYTTETRVSNMIAEAQLGGGEVDLSGYATKDDLRTKSDVGHGHSYNDLTNKPTIPSITGLATTTYVDTGLSKKSDTHTHPYKSDTYVPTWSEITGKPTIPTVDVNKAYVDGELAKKSNTGHRHDASEIDNLPTSGGSSDVTKAYVDSQDKVLDDKITVLNTKVDGLELGDSSNSIDVTNFAYEVVKAIQGGDGEPITYANANNYLKIPVYNNPNDYQATHPSVLYFQNAWNGYKFWMAFTPYENENESIENPSIVASKDGLNWEVPNGLTNPLDITNNVNEYHNSDTHLVFVDGQLECWYRKRTRGTLGDGEVIKRCVSTNGIDWSLGQEVIKFEGSFDKKLSPVILYEDFKYKVWFCNFSDSKIEYFEGQDANNLSKIRDISMPSCDGLKVWHMDIKHTCNNYEMYFCAGSTYQCYSMYYASSIDNVTYGTATKIMKNSEDNFDRLLYRPSIVDVGFDRYMYYGGVNKSSGNKWYIGLTKGKIYSPTIFDGRVISNADVTGVTINQSSINIIVGKSQKLIATVLPNDAKDKTVIWSSSNSNVATVDGNGNVAGVSVGNSTITVTTVQGNFTANCTVEVKEDISATIKPGDNLFDRSNIIEGGFYDSTTGAWKTDSAHNSSGYIEVSPGIELVRDNNSAGLCYWDENKSFISGLAYNVKTGTVPPNTKYITFAYIKSGLNGIYLMLTTPAENDIPINEELFNKSNVTSGQYVDPAGVIKQDALYGMSEYIKALPGITLSSANTLRISLFDSRKQYIGVASGTISTTTQKHCMYAVVSFEMSKIDTVTLKRTQ